MLYTFFGLTFPLSILHTFTSSFFYVGNFVSRSICFKRALISFNFFAVKKACARALDSYVLLPWATDSLCCSHLLFRHD